MEESKPLNTSNPTGMLEFTKDDCPKNAKEKQEMEKYPMRTAVGCLLYLSLMTRPVITKAVSAASSIVSNPGKAHWKNIGASPKWTRKKIKMGRYGPVKEIIFRPQLSHSTSHHVGSALPGPSYPGQCSKFLLNSRAHRFSLFPTGLYRTVGD